MEPPEHIKKMLLEEKDLWGPLSYDPPKEGAFTYNYPDTTCYTGQWREKKKWGKGKIHWPSGKIFYY